MIVDIKKNLARYLNTTNSMQSNFQKTFPIPITHPIYGPNPIKFYVQLDFIYTLQSVTTKTNRITFGVFYNFYEFFPRFFSFFDLPCFPLDLFINCKSVKWKTKITEEMSFMNGDCGCWPD